jgi:hypothetical protein
MMPNSSKEVNPDLEKVFSEIRNLNLNPYTPLPEKLNLLKASVPTLALMTNLDEAATLEEFRARLGLREKDLDALRADVKAARNEREEKEKRGQVKTQEISDLQEVLRLHPVLDFPSDAMIIGFRADLSDNGTGLVLVISDSQGVRHEINPEAVEAGGRLYQVTKNITPPLLSDVWEVNRLKTFLENPTMPDNLYHDLVGAFKAYLDLPEQAYGLMAAWTVGTYFAHLFTAFPFLHFYGPKESGKSKSLEALECVCFNAWKGRDITPAALGNTVDDLRGTLLLDQAERLNNDREGGTLIGLLADSYKKSGGKRRVVEISKAGRKVLEFPTYGPKAFASTKNLDPDLADRVVSIPMTRTRRQLPDLEGWEPIWVELRDRLYRFTLTAFKQVKAHYEANPGNGKRLGELWRPMVAVFLALGVSEMEVEAVRRLFMSAAKETRHEPSSWECALLEALRDEAQTHVSPFNLTVRQIITAMNLKGDQPRGKWVGDTLSHYHLYLAKKRVGKRNETTYQFDPARVIDLCNLYLREDGTGEGGERKLDDTPHNDVSIVSTQDNANDVLGLTQENARPHSTLEQELYGDPKGGREGTCPPKMTCPPHPAENTTENDGGREGHEKSGDTPKEIFPDLLEGEL